MRLSLLPTHCVSTAICGASADAAKDALVADEIRQAAEHVPAHFALVDQAALLAEQLAHLREENARLFGESPAWVKGESAIAVPS